MQPGLVVMLLGVALPSSGATSPPPIAVQAGGKSFPVPGGVICRPAPSNWKVSNDAQMLQPPAAVPIDENNAAVRVAERPGLCARQSWQQQLVVTGRWPVFDPTGVVAWLDEGRVELRGSNLKGITVEWKAGGRKGNDVCIEPVSEGKLERCTLTLGKKLPADPSSLSLVWRPAGVDPGEETVFFDDQGKLAPVERFRLRVARAVIGPPLPPEASIDLVEGSSRVPLDHPEAIAGADCGPFRCQVEEGALVVHPSTSLASTVTIRLRLAPKVFVSKGNGMEPTAVASLPLVRCPIAFASGPPLRGADGTHVIVRVGARCENGVEHLRWFANGDAARAVREERVGGASFVVLRVGRVERQRLTLVATRDDPDHSIVASISSETQIAPEPIATLEIPGSGVIDFIPKNREAVVHVAEGGGDLAVVPVKGVYEVRAEKEKSYVRGSGVVGGLTSLRFGYRAKGLPAGLADVDLAVLAESIARPIREATIPIDLSARGGGATPLFELLCQDHGDLLHVQAGVTAQIPFQDRDSCRLVSHRESLRPEDGAQLVTIEADVSKPDGDTRSGGHVSERMLLRFASTPRTIWFHGIKRPFDRLQVRLTHAQPETLTLADASKQDELTEAQWSVIVGSGSFRFYATATIPTGLYRVNAPSAVLSLDFGILSRLVPLTREGRESFLGVELGAMGMNLGGLSNYPASLALIAGLGVSLPLGSSGEVTQSSVSLHAWVIREFRKDACTSPSLSPGTAGCTLADHWAFIFGPSISIGDIGANFW